jgi:RNA polymerase sigma factor (sigma-70 family)
MDIDPMEHTGLAHSCVRRMGIPRGSQDFEDFFQDAMTGIIKAVGTFDPSQGKWTTYAGRFARNEINRGPRYAAYKRRKRGLKDVVVTDLSAMENVAPDLFRVENDPAKSVEIADVPFAMTPQMEVVYDLLYRQDMTMHAAAVVMKCSPQNVSQIHDRLKELGRARLSTAA